MNKSPTLPKHTIGMELFEIKPVMLGGHPTDPKNTVWLTREQHIQAVRFWNKTISEHRRRQNR